MGKNKTLYLDKYKRPSFTTDHVDLAFDIQEDHTTVTSTVNYTRTKEGKNAKYITLDAECPNEEEEYLVSIMQDGIPLTEGVDYKYDRDNHKIKIPFPASRDEMNIEIETYLKPEENLAYSGFYKSDSCYVTQCESEGFRRITPFLDRPDVLATYTVRIDGDRNFTPVMMANGELVTGLINPDDKQRHYAIYHDPHPKPSYLFATANGRLEYVQNVFPTMSGKNVTNRVYTESGDRDKAYHALNAIEMSMKWDEETFGCEYDLDNFNIVSLAGFNMGAMENKGLNIFLDALVLANPEIATDGTYQSIIDIIGHEYFHNWSGNRVTLANWFNLSLKEGLTVIREQMFTAHTTSVATERIEAVQYLRAGQFGEDDGPLSHPVMPTELESVDNVYSNTVYQKGAEVIRMMKTMMGDEKFIEGVKHYFKTYDGQAVTIDEFVNSMEKASDLDFSGQFKLWYTQSGRPKVTANGVYDPAAKTYTLTMEQENAPTKDQAHKEPMFIPVKMGLVDENGNDMPLALQGDKGEPTERVLEFTDKKQTFVFENVDKEPAYHSLFRDFSAPVDCNANLSLKQLRQQLTNDPNGFNRWEAGQKLGMTELIRLYESYVATGKMPAVDPDYIETTRNLLLDTETDPALLALALIRPGTKGLEQAVKPVNPAAIAAVQKALRETLGTTLRDEYIDVFNRLHSDERYSFDYESVGKRKLKAVALGEIMAQASNLDLNAASGIYNHANNMTDRMMAMGALCDYASPQRQSVLDSFYNRFKDDGLTIQKWFAMQASANSDDVMDQITKLEQEDCFDIKVPGHSRALYGSFVGNYEQFHRADGEGYKFIADFVIRIDKQNNQLAAGFAPALASWRKYSEDHQKMMIEQLERINAVKDLSKDVREIVTKSLPDKKECKTLGIAPPSI